MKSTARYSFLMLFAILFITYTSYGQDETIEETTLQELQAEEVINDTWTSPRVTDEMTIDSEQNKSWRMGQSKFSAKPKHGWELGVHFGHMFIDGDVDREIPGGYGLGLHLRRAIHYVFSIRADLFYGEAKGLDPQPWRHKYDTNSNGVGGGLVEDVFDPYNPNRNGPSDWFPAHKTRYIYGALQGIVNIGNILWHKERNKWNWYAGIGVGLDTHKAMLDLLDGNGNAYTNLVNATGVDQDPDKFNTKEGRNLIKDDLRAMYDGVYETEGFQKRGIFRVGDETNIHVVWTASMGVSRKISKRINIGLEHQIMLSDNDYLDGIKFRTSLDQTNNVDIPHYTNIRIGINLGNFDKVTEPLYWMNPLDATFNDIAALKQRPQLDLTDEDEDGVIDMLDQELDTPEGCAVDTRGITLDSDGDGLADCEDNEPYSPPGCQIDEYGVAQCDNPCCVDEEDIQKMIDTRTELLKSEIKTEIRSTPVTVTNPDGTTTTTYVPSTSPNGNPLSTSCGDWFLPMIHYDLDSYTIKPEYYSQIHHVAQVMKKCPEICVVAQGHTDNRSSSDYNNGLSYKRANEAVEYLVNNYGVDRSRMKIMYGGEENPLISAPGSEAHHYMNRRVEFRTCTANDFDMGPPDGAGAKSGTGGTGSTINKNQYFNGNKNSGYE